MSYTNALTNPTLAERLRRIADDVRVFPAKDRKALLLEAAVRLEEQR